MPPIGGWKTGVYLIKNMVNGKVYVGSSSCSLRDRLKDHRSSLASGRSHNRHLQAAWLKYGALSFRFVILERCSPVKCLEREQWWMDKLGAVNPNLGYNQRPRAENNLGFRHSPESLERVRAANKSRIASETPEQRANRCRGIMVGTVTEDHRRKISAALLGSVRSPETREKISKAQVGKVLSEDHKRRTSAALKGRRKPLEAVAKMKATKLVTCRTPEFRAKMAKAARLQWAKRKADAKAKVLS